MHRFLANLFSRAASIFDRSCQIALVAPVSIRVNPHAKWRSLPDLAGPRRLSASGFHGRKVKCLGRLRSKAVGSQHGENGDLAPRKAPVSAIFRPIFADFLRVFLRAWR
jgi:hypothetical protein